VLTIYSEWHHPTTEAVFPAGTQFTQLPLPGNTWHWLKPDGERGHFVLDGIPGT
jgi:hypothetical protein